MTRATLEPVAVPLAFPDTVDEVKAAVAAAGFGVLSEIDVQRTLHDKIGSTIEPYLILGVCNPQLAYQALSVDRSVGALLPCTIVLRADGDDRTIVEIQDPSIMVELTGRRELSAVAERASALLGDLRRALASHREQA
jgi:uncharacterized protein (DUF302 family)